MEKVGQKYVEYKWKVVEAGGACATTGTVKYPGHHAKCRKNFHHHYISHQAERSRGNSMLSIALLLLSALVLSHLGN